MTPEIQQRIFNRLVETGHADQPWALIVLAALKGGPQLRALLDGVSTVAMPAIAALFDSVRSTRRPDGVLLPFAAWKNGPSAAG